MAYEGVDFQLLCLYNGDTRSVDFIAEWNKDNQKDITNEGPYWKYQSERTDGDCSGDQPCCSFSDLLTVTNVSAEDSGFYSCVAASVAAGDPPFGASRSTYIGEPFLVQIVVGLYT